MEIVVAMMMKRLVTVVQCLINVAIAPAETEPGSGGISDDFGGVAVGQ